MFRRESRGSGEEWSIERRIVAAAAEIPMALRRLIAERLERLCGLGRAAGESEVLAAFDGIPPRDVAVLVRLWAAFSHERLTTIAEWGESRPEMGDKNESERYEALAKMLAAAPACSVDEWTEMVTWLTNLLAELPPTTRARLRDLIEREVAEFASDEDRGSAPAAEAPRRAPAVALRERSRGRQIGLAMSGAVGLFCLITTSYGWATAVRDYRAEALKSGELQAEKAAIVSEIADLHEVSGAIAKIQDHLLVDEVDSPRLVLKQVNARIDLLTEAVEDLFQLTSGEE